MLIEGGLPTRITGIVFWGVVLIGSLAAAMLLHGEGRQQIIRNTSNSALLVQKIDETLAQKPTVPLLQTHRQTLQQLVEAWRNPLGFESLKLALGNEVWLYGKTHSYQSAVTHTLLIPPLQAGQP